MEVNNQHIDELLAKYFAGEALPEEAMFIDDWKATSDDNQLYFTNAQHIFNVKFKKVDEQKLFAEIVKKSNINTTHEPKRFSLGLSWLKVAALFLFVSIGVLVYFKLSKSEPDVVIATTAESQTKTLADGTKVTMNSQATLTVIGGYNNKLRKLKLSGEAFFEVKHNDELPFVIDAGGVEIKDIGTAFNVKALPQSDSVMVFVTEGIVELNTETESLAIHANQSALYIRSTKSLIQLNHVDANVLSYKTKAFSFKAALVKDVVASINAVYGNVIVLANDQLGNCLITVDFSNESPEVMAMIIAETLGLTYQKTNGVFVLSGQSCQQ